MDDETHAGTDARTDADDLPALHAFSLTVDEAAALLGKSADTVRRYIRQGRLASERVQGERTIEYRLSPADVEDLLGRQDAVEATTSADPSPATTPAMPADARPEAREGRVPAGTDARMQLQAVMQAVVQPLVDDLRQARERTEQLASENAVLRERLRVAEQRRPESRRLPWWVRLVLGR